MPIIYLHKSDQIYLQKCAVELGFSSGIIIGQQAEAGKFITVHLAKNCEEDVEEGDKNEGEHNSHVAQKIEDIGSQNLACQWLSACKMIPGSFTVLGIFVTGSKAEIIDEATFKSAKRLLYDVQNLLTQSRNFFGASDEFLNNDLLFLAYSVAAKKAVCKLYTCSSNGGSFSPMDCRFIEKPFDWYTFECCYELNDIFPILDHVERINVEHQFHKTILAMKRNLAACEIFIQNEDVDDEITLGSYVQNKKAPQKRQSLSETYKATIFLPVKCQTNREHPVKVSKFNGTIRFSGVISSRVWCNPQNTLGDVKHYVRTDILRSLTARIQVYCDGLTDPTVSNDAIFISEPPRRVYFSLSAVGAETPVQFSEYIFRGEAPTVAVAQAKQVLDLDINTESILGDLEGLPDDEAFSEGSSYDNSGSANSNSPTSSMAGTQDLTRTMYMLGIAVSLLVLLLSILLHFLLK